MTQVLTVRKPALVDPVSRLRRVSRTFATATTFAMFGITFAIAGAWLLPLTTGITLVPRLGRFREYFDDPTARLVAFMVIVVLLGIFLFALEQARRLFDEFADGDILTTHAALRLQRIAYAIIVGSIAKPIGQSVLRAVIGPLPSDGFCGRAMFLPLREIVSDVAFLLAGLFLLAIAWALAEAARIAADHRQII
jgi:Protein of unknown function (DUF2975)